MSWSFEALSPLSYINTTQILQACQEFAEVFLLVAVEFPSFNNWSLDGGRCSLCITTPWVSYIRAKYRFCPRVNDMTLAYRTYLALKVQMACEAKVLNSFSSAMYILHNVLQNVKGYYKKNLFRFGGEDLADEFGYEAIAIEKVRSHFLRFPLSR